MSLAVDFLDKAQLKLLLCSKLLLSTIIVALEYSADHNIEIFI